MSHCAVCDTEHDEPPRDVAFGLPDEIFALSDRERSERVRSDGEECVLDGSRHFVRTILLLRTPDRVEDDGDQSAAIGLWVELSPGDAEAVRTFDERHAGDRALVRGRLANTAPGWPETRGLAVVVRPVSRTARPEVVVEDGSHPLADAQRDGLPWDLWLRFVGKTDPGWARHRFFERLARFRIEDEEPVAGTCDCCGAPALKLSRFLWLDDRFLAACFAVAVQDPSSPHVDVLIALGDFQDEAVAPKRVAFALRCLREGARVMDARAWPDVILAAAGTPLERDEALRHPELEDAFEITDVLREIDPVISAVLGPARPEA